MWFDLMNELTLESENEREGKTMSAKREHRRRLNLRLKYAATFCGWLMCEPPMWRFRAWRKWKKARPVWNNSKELFAHGGFNVERG